MYGALSVYTNTHTHTSIYIHIYVHSLGQINISYVRGSSNFGKVLFVSINGHSVAVHIERTRVRFKD